MQFINLFFIAALATSGLAAAQEPGSTPQPGVSPFAIPPRVIRNRGSSSEQPGIPSTAGTPPPPGNPAPMVSATDDVIPIIDFPNTDIQSVLEFYEMLTGKKALYDNTVQGKIRVRVTKQVTKVEAIQILETSFALNNFILIPGPGNIVKVISANKNVRQFDIPIYSEVSQLPDGNEVVSYLFRLEYANAGEVKEALAQVVAPTPNLTNIVALPKSQTVLVTEHANMIRNLVPIVEKLDCKPAEVVSTFIPLERADAKEVVEKLTKMFEKSPNSTATAGTAPQGDKAPQGNTSATGPADPMITLSEDSLVVGKIKIEADLRTNRVHVITRPVNLPFLRSVIADLDCKLPQGEPATRPLRYVLAADVLDVVAGAVAEPGVEVKNLDSSAHASGAANPVNNTSANYSNTNSVNSANSTDGGSRNGSRNSSISSGAFGSNNATLQTDTAPAGRIIRNTKIIADNRTNAIIVVGNDEIKKKVFNLLDQIDVRAPQVMLTAVIGELTLDNDEEFGVDYLLNKGNLGNVLSSGSLPWTLPSGGGSSLKNIISAASLPSTGGGVTGLVGVSNSLDVFVKALQSTGRYKITSRPMIFTSNNRPAVISSGESIAVPSTINSSYTTGTNLVSTASVDYIDVALKLSVLPLINSDGEVTLQITQDDNNTDGSTTISGNAIPNVTTRRIDTTVSVANEATIVLGGLVSEKKQVNNSGVPGLCKIPVLGSLFSYKTNTTTRTELVVLIRPTVTRGPIQAIKAGERAMEKTNFEPDLDASLDPPGKKVNAKLLETPKLGLPEK